METETGATTRNCILRIGDSAPAFKARSTAGAVSLADFRGRWLILFSHPADFTPVCTTEFVELAKLGGEFDKRDCALMALSVDSLFAHFAWLRLIRDRFGVEVRFPIIEDPTMVIANAYGMVMKGDRDSAAVRSTYFIDPEGTIQATTCYPSTVGRSVPEILRTLDALQAVRSKGTLAPANWQAGERMLRPPETDIDAIFSSDNEVDWFYRETKA
ncbi:MAG: peroxiredoxin [Sphingomonadaceae bacterium]|nr:peroxiredoxin [Sphingomonadaceae bacterium]MCP5384247.1 peroxiredoxin [Altererythrobacter sp.]MCP5391800.1 peroxiredoxin [Sphingomonadaceae bacterium]